MWPVTTNYIATIHSEAAERAALYEEDALRDYVARNVPACDPSECAKGIDCEDCPDLRAPAGPTEEA